MARMAALEERFAAERAAHTGQLLPVADPFSADSGWALQEMAHDPSTLLMRCLPLADL